MPIDIQTDDLKTALTKLKARENSFKQLESISQLGSWEVDLITKESIWSEQSYKIYGLDKNLTTPNLELFFSLLLPEDLLKAKTTLETAIASGEVVTLQAKITRADGTIRDILLNGQVIFNQDKQPIKLIGSTQDITEQVASQRDSKEFLELIEHSSNEIYIIDFNKFEYLYVNKGATLALGYSSDELLEMNIFDINPNLNIKQANEMKTIGLKEGKLLNRTIHKRKDGSTYHVQSLVHPIKYKNKQAFVIFDTDITKHIEDEEKLKRQALELNYQANYDSLTTLPNRMLFKKNLSQAISQTAYSHQRFALLFIDLDQFKQINDSLGHHVGDKVLVEISHRLLKLITEDNILARLGGDEFTVIMKNIANIREVSKKAQEIIDLIKQPINVDGHTMFISSSIGISIYPTDSDEANNLIKYSDVAMYKAKDEGRDNFQFYSSEMTTLAFERVMLENNLRVAIKEDQFVVYFQPQINSLNGKITGMEALVRWIHPDVGLIPPSKFIPIAEENGLVVAIDRIVMKKAMQQFSTWYANGLEPGVLALNLAMKQLNQKDFIPMLLENMRSVNFQSQWLELEVTEGQIMNNPSLSIEKLNKIHDLGIEIAIDDFGTGYSSLSYLKKLPLDKLKIDQSFLVDIPYNEDDVAITRAIISLAKSLNLKIIAEGVETIKQKEFLIENGCTSVQGYFYARPMPQDDVTKLLQIHKRDKN